MLDFMVATEKEVLQDDDVKPCPCGMKPELLCINDGFEKMGILPEYYVMCQCGKGTGFSPFVDQTNKEQVVRFWNYLVEFVTNGNE